jgi:hypothetical protein
MEIRIYKGNRTVKKSAEVERAQGVGTMFACTKCQTVRQCGFGMPDNINYTPPLNCSRCGTVTPHRFSRLAPMVRLKLPYGDVRWVLEGQSHAETM